MPRVVPPHVPASPRLADPRTPNYAEAPLLDAEQEIALGYAIARGDLAARDRLIRANVRLVISIAAEYRGRGLDHEDLVGEGNLGLLRAAADFDPARGVRFSTYASYWIRNSIRMALTDTSRTIRIPAHMARLLSKWRRAERELMGEGGEPPAEGLVAGRLGLCERQRSLARFAIRANQTRGGDIDWDWMSELVSAGEGPGGEMDRDEETAGIRARMAERLDARERELIALRFGLGEEGPMTLKEAGARLGVTREWARKLEKRAVAKLV